MVKNNKMTVLLFCMFACSLTLFAQNNKRKTAVQKVKYVEDDSIKNTKLWVPRVSSDSRICVVNDAKSAAIVASVYAANIFGCKISKIEQPYSVSALNDSLWYVEGTTKPRSKHKPWRGSFLVIIEKKTGKLVSFMHDK